MEDEIGFSGLMPQWREDRCNLDIPKSDSLTLPCHGSGKTKVEREKDKVVQCPQLFWQMSEDTGGCGLRGWGQTLISVVKIIQATDSK